MFQKLCYLYSTDILQRLTIFSSFCQWQLRFPTKSCLVLSRTLLYVIAMSWHPSLIVLWAKSNVIEHLLLPINFKYISLRPVLTYMIQILFLSLILFYIFIIHLRQHIMQCFFDVLHYRIGFNISSIQKVKVVQSKQHFIPPSYFVLIKKL